MHAFKRSHKNEVAISQIADSRAPDVGHFDDLIMYINTPFTTSEQARHACPERCYEGVHIHHKSQKVML